MNTPKIATSATGTEYTGPDPYPQCEGSGASPCSPTIYEVLRNNIKAIDPETEKGVDDFLNEKSKELRCGITKTYIS